MGNVFLLQKAGIRDKPRNQAKPQGAENWSNFCQSKQKKETAGTAEHRENWAGAKSSETARGQ